MADLRTATAKVTVVVEVTTSDCWGADCTINQAERQARESAIGVLGRMVRECPMVRVVRIEATEVRIACPTEVSRG